MVKKNKETLSSKEIRLKKMKERLANIEKKKKLEKQLAETEKKLRKARTKSKPKKISLPSIPVDTGIKAEKVTSLFKPQFKKVDSLAGVRNPINDSERMWVMSVWENRKKIDPNFDIDRWFISSVHLDNDERNNQIDDFWEGKGEQDTTNFWMH